MIETSIVVPEIAKAHIERQRPSRGPKGQFVQSVIEDYQQLLPYLPPVDSVQRILDIGCGMCGIDVLLLRHYPAAVLWLLDQDGDDPRDGWGEPHGTFSSRAAADELLASNGFKAARWIDADTKEALTADLVIGLASWGYHFPLRTYDVTGYCIADLRSAKESPRGKIIQSYPKRNRCAWHNKGKG